MIKVNVSAATGNKAAVVVIGVEDFQNHGHYIESNSCRILSWPVFLRMSRVPAVFVMTRVCFVVIGKHTVYRMSAATPEEKDEWIKCVR
jgi:hypothetical protein